MELRVTGQTKDAGFQIGVRRTLQLTQAEVWEKLTSPEGMRLWLGAGSNDRVQLESGQPYRLKSGACGEFRIVKPREQLRLTWQPAGWPKASTIQVRLLPGTGPQKTTLAFHQEHLPDAVSREQMKRHWEYVLRQWMEQ